MIALDTKVLVRYIVQDDPAQAGAASQLVEPRCTADEPALVAMIVLCELASVLDRGYRYSRSQVAEVVRAILSSEELEVEGAELAWRALRLYEEGRADLADYLIGAANRERGADSTFTFDRAAAESELFTLVTVG